VTDDERIAAANAETVRPPPPGEGSSVAANASLFATMPAPLMAWNPQGVPGEMLAIVNASVGPAPSPATSPADAPRLRSSRPPPSKSHAVRKATKLNDTFESAMANLSVALEPIADAKTKTLLGFAARMSSTVETLMTESALVVAAEHLDRLEFLRRRVRDLAVKAFAQAPQDALLFVDVHPSDLLDGDLYSPEPPLARIADRVVLQVRARGLGIQDLSARASVLRFVGFRLAVADLDAGQACLSQIADLSPEFVKIDARLVRDMDGSAGRRRIVSALVSMCRTLDAVPVAEGVSTAEEREALLEAGCSVVQGAIAARHVPVR
jgi:EAL domain-containing protein (putative c-di-GMP-specific phosphodiesterase class I)